MKRVILKKVHIKRQRTPIAKSQKVTGSQHQGIRLLNNGILKRFDPSMLDLGDLSSPSKEIEAITAVFDLSGFTKFCSQADAYLAIPKFLNDFLSWFFSKIRLGLTEVDDWGRSSFWAELPIMVKFLGDGILLLWNARGMTESQMCKIVATLYDICYAYKHEFYPKISMAVNEPPGVLRCGVARGKVFSVGDGRDYVGHCINNASRLSQLRLLSFCFPHRGFQVQEYMPDQYYRIFVPKYVSIRGVGDNELVWLVKEEFDRLPEKGKALFRNLDN
jgi:hypothetical protein